MTATEREISASTKRSITQTSTKERQLIAGTLTDFPELPDCRRSYPMQKASKTVTVVIVDATPLFGRGLTSVIEAKGSIHVIGQASNLEEAMYMINERKPDVVLTVTRGSLPDCRQLAQSIRAAGFTGAIVVLDSSFTEDECFKAIQLGTDGCLCQEWEHEEISSAIIHASHSEDMVLLRCPQH